MATNPVEEKIITATVECIEKYGIKGTTIRQIAEVAGVNSAAINYYFRSKDILIERCMKQTLHNAFDWEDIEKLPGSTASERCKHVFYGIMEGGINYPGITRAHFYDLLVDGNYLSPMSGAINQFLDNLVKDLKSRGATLPEDELYIVCIQITNAVMMLVLMPGLFEKRYGVDLLDREQRQEYVDQMVDRLLS
ncbi:MAG: TetR family transcriptional regulator [Leptolinea sp.]|jgi:AcrR family transcriptional regulator|nr:TetR family transcriptional regulator [Leptolinea sp.]